MLLNEAASISKLQRAFNERRKSFPILPNRRVEVKDMEGIIGKDPRFSLHGIHGDRHCERADFQLKIEQEVRCCNSVVSVPPYT